MPMKESAQPSKADDGSGLRIEPGQLLADKYRVISFIGRGAAGAVYKVEQVFLKRNFALKLFGGGNSASNSIIRFQQEAQLSSQLEHPNLVRATDFGVLCEGQPFLVMDLVEGPTLEQVLKQKGSLSLADVTDIFAPVCLALHYAHTKGMVHRDIKPGNIMLDGATESSIGAPKIVDFGIAKAIEEAGLALTRTGEVFGTPLYMSPEQCFGRRVDARSDIYSLGCVIFEALTGAPPFRGASVLETISMHMHGNPLSLRESSLGREIPAVYESIVGKLLSKDPDARYQDCLQLRSDLLSAQQGTITKASASNDGNAADKRKRWKPIILAGTAVVAVSLPFAYLLKTNLFNDMTTDQAAVSTATVSIPSDMSDKVNAKSHIVKPTAASSATNEKVAATFDDANLDPIKILTQADNKTKLPDLPKVYCKPVPKSMPGSHPKVFKFPENFSIGTIRYLDTGRAWSDSMPASGTVFVPKGGKVKFKIDLMLFLKHPKEIMAPFRDGDLNGIEIRTVGEGFADNAGKLDDDLKYMKHVTNSLEELRLYSPNISDTGLHNLGLESMYGLRRISLRHTKIHMSTLARMSFLKNLVELQLDGNSEKPTAVLKQLQGNTNVSHLELQQSQLNDDDLAIVSSMPNVKYLALSNNPQITKNGFELLTKMPNVKYLCLFGCNIKPTDAALLAKMPRLDSLVVPKEYWTRADVDQFRRMLGRNCEVKIRNFANDHD